MDGRCARIIICNAVIDENEILSKKLVEKTAQVGVVLYDSLATLAAKYPNWIQNFRDKNNGTYIAFDTPDSSNLLKKMRELGINIGSCGVQTVRLGPMLIFEEAHIAPLLVAFETAFSHFHISTPHPFPRTSENQHSRTTPIKFTRTLPLLVFLLVASQMSFEDIQSDLKKETYHYNTPEAFIPYESVQKIWVGDRLEQFLKTQDPSLGRSDIAVAREGLLRTISILTGVVPRDWSGWSRFRQIFFPPDDDVADRRRDKNILDFTREELERDSFLRDTNLAGHFVTHRWSYFPVVLNDNEADGEDEEDSYGENYRLPLFREDHVLRQGGYGEVTKEIIPPNHIILGHLSDDIGIPKAPHPVKLIVARKRFFPRANSDLEVRLLKLLRSSLSSHKQIVSNLAIFKIRNEWNIIMPWADIDLEDFLAGGYREMQSTPPAPLLDDLIAESRKVASAIHFLHENLQLESEWEEFRQLAICHADLKPRNVLVFKREGSSTGVWRISDFGVSRVARRALSETRRRGSGYTTSLNDHSPKGGAYQAPEPRTQRRSDVWSFGCILVRVFALGLDPASLAELDESRRKPLVGRVLDDSFYQKDPPALHPSIESWLQSLPAQYHTTHNLGFLEKMQKLLRSMLQIDYHQRSSAHEVRSDLHALHSSGSSRMSIHSPASTETYQGTDHGIDPPHPSAPVEGVGVLVTVIKSGTIDNVRQALRGNVDVEQCDQGERPLIHAIEVTSPAKIKALSEYQRKFHNRNLNVRAPSSKGKTPLYLAICKGDVDTVEAVIDANIGPDSNADTNTLLSELCGDKTPLMQAAFLGHTGVISLLLERGADHRICVQQQKLNCLHYAVKFGNHAKEDVIGAFKYKMIFDQLPPNIPLDSGGNPPKPVAYVTPMLMHIRLALDGSCTSLEPDSLWGRKFKALLDGGASAKRTYGAGTPLETSPLEIAVMQNNLLVVRALVGAGATLPVGYSVPHGTFKHIKKLLKNVKREHPVPGH
ncbi:hypothetical protein N7519_008751 [Penicillium mononematosum]|uniref:uncharacterized protein n=1 Tax=Penicillium mononematosum TaxID=268346 RepID=UPI002548419B|nr:uncharacterized protein N7519_008751 [Penicillium mononematosum]KAJ6178290.1 hypothetical protein N7519_008751 [Penicillium mononematosum]